MNEFAGKTVWITGASSGIGEALAVEFSARGARLILSARDAGKLRSLSERLLALRPPAGRRTEGTSTQREESGGSNAAEDQRVIVRRLDVTNREDVAAAAGEVAELVGGIDLLVHAAGVSQRATAIETQPSAARRIMETNFFGTVDLTLAVLPKMIAAGSGRIVVVTSVFGKFGAPKRTSYAASKHALHGYFDSLRGELPEAIRVTLAVPGAVATNISMNALTGDGSPLGVVERGISHGMSAESCARKIVRAIMHDRDEVHVALAFRARAALILKHYAPRLLTRILRKARLT